MRRSCVIDTTTLVIFSKLNKGSLLISLREIFSEIHVPLKVKEEFEDVKALQKEPFRKSILAQMKLDSGFLRICSHYDTISFEILRTRKGIDAGEAEAVAQHKYVNSNYVLSDDKKFVQTIKSIDPYIKVFGSLHLVAWLDFLDLIRNPTNALKEIYSLNRFNSSQLRLAYKDIIQLLGIRISKKELNKKVSLRELGIDKIKSNPQVTPIRNINQ